jgi:hypothetical protein
MSPKIPKLTQLQLADNAASRASPFREKGLKLCLHPEQTHIVSIMDEVSKTGMVTEDIRQGQVLRNLNDSRVENMTRVIGPRNLDQRSLAVGTAGVRDVAIPTAALAEDSHRMKIKAAM